MRHTKLFFVLALLLLVNSVFAGRYYDAATGRWLQVDPLADNYPSWSPYNYTLNNPIKNVDPDGNFVETAIDVVSVALSAKDFYDNPTLANAGWLLADIAGAALPFVPSVGIVLHAGKIDNVVDLVKGADKANDIRKNYKRGKQGEKIVTEALQKEFGESKKV
ncbi:RHS repeat-associated core domain-containing protein [Calditrichota bacterium GD2]